MRVLVAGDRNWSDPRPIEIELCRLAVINDIEVIEGEAEGADKIARRIARAFGWPVWKFPADWDKYGRAAGPIRNQRMLDEGTPDVVLIFHPNIFASRGSKDMYQRAVKAGIKTYLINK
jgi:hypothetical protein